jgi:hypothetical protein
VVKRAKAAHRENQNLAHMVRENYKEAYKLHCHNIELLRKQMVLVEVIKDIFNVKSIIDGLLVNDNTIDQGRSVLLRK